VRPRRSDARRRRDRLDDLQPLQGFVFALLRGIGHGLMTQAVRERAQTDARQEAERMLQASNAAIENTIRTIRESQAEKERTKEVSIKSGDTLSEIAERNGTTVAKLRKINKIKGNSIRAGKKIRVK